MFSSPSIRLYTSEDADNLVQKKPVNNISRKPFLDRSVNSKTPDPSKVLKSKLSIATGPAIIEKPKRSPKSDLKAEDFIFSFKDVEDNYEDIWPRQQCLSTENLVKILRNYCNIEATPPPSPKHVPQEIDPVFFELPSSPKHITLEIDPMFLELPHVDEPQLLDEDIWNESYDVKMPAYD